MEYMKDYPFEFTNPLELCFRVLDHCNINFFDDDVSPLKKYWNYVVMIPCVILQYYSSAMFIVDVVTRKDVVELASSVGIYMIITQSIIEVIILMLNKKKVRFIIIQLGSTWRSANLTAMQFKKKNAVLKRLDFYLKVYYHCTILGSVMYVLTPLAEILVRKFILHQEWEFILPYRCKYPFNYTQSGTIYALVYLFQTYAMYYFLLAYLGTGCIIVVLCSHLVTGFTLLHEDLLHIIPVPNKRFNEDIDDVVRRHQKLILICQQLDEVFNKINFVTLVFATVIICFFAFAAKVTHGSLIMYVNYLAVPGVLAAIFLVCYYSELLATESAGIADSAYNSPWYKGSTNHQKSICFIIQRAQVPCCLTSLKYSPITLNTFSKVLSTSWSYFSLISGVYEEGNGM